MPSGIAKKSVKILFISRQKLKTSLCERQDFFYCLLIYLIYLKSGPRSKDQLHQLDLRFKNTKAYRSASITVYFNLTTDDPDFPDVETA